MKNKVWADNILEHIAPKYRHRWEVYEEYLRSYLLNLNRLMYVVYVL